MTQLIEKVLTERFKIPAGAVETVTSQPKKLLNGHILNVVQP